MERNGDGNEHRKQPKLGQESVNKHPPTGNNSTRDPSTSIATAKASDTPKGNGQRSTPSKVTQSSKSIQTTEFYVSLDLVVIHA